MFEGTASCSCLTPAGGTCSVVQVPMITLTSSQPDSYANRCWKPVKCRQPGASPLCSYPGSCIPSCHPLTLSLSTLCSSSQEFLPFCPYPVELSPHQPSGPEGRGAAQAFDPPAVGGGPPRAQTSLSHPPEFQQFRDFPGQVWDCSPHPRDSRLK